MSGGGGYFGFRAAMAAGEEQKSGTGQICTENKVLPLS